MYKITNKQNIGHRFGHQLGLDESSGQTSRLFLHGCALPVDLVFVKICMIINNMLKCMFVCLIRGISFKTKENGCGKPETP